MQQVLNHKDSALPASLLSYFFTFHPSLSLYQSQICSAIMAQHSWTSLLSTLSSSLTHILRPLAWLCSTKRFSTVNAPTLPLPSYQNAKAVITTRQNVTMGLKKGNTVLLHYQFHGQLYQAIWQMAGSAKGGKDTHKLWKHVIPRSTDGFPKKLLKPSAYRHCSLIPDAPMEH